MDFQILGPVRARVGSRTLDLGNRKERLVLAVLLLEPDQLVPVDRLIDLLWRDSPPASARRIVQAHLSRLRTRLANAVAGRTEVSLVRRGQGYVLSCDPQRVDVHQFRGLVRTARRTDELPTRARLLRQALALWQGPAVSDAASDEERHRLCPGLDEAYWSAAEDRFEAELRMGLEMQFVDELTDLANRRPHRQRLVGQLMLAYHRLGRTADAVALYAQLRERLAADLGLEPSTVIQKLHVAILRADPTLQRVDVGPAPAKPFTPPVRVASPAQLPAADYGFVGRATALAELDRVTDADATAVPIAVVTGGPGIGKTALAVQWARQRLDRFPDGQLHVDLGGHSSGTGPLTPMAALTALLAGLGVTPPEEVTEAVACYRSALARKRAVILLDDARHADQVRPLVPGGAGCVVVVTSRHRLGGLVAQQGARQVQVAELTGDEAYELLARTSAGDRVRAQPAAGELVRLCGSLPLALRTVATNLSGWHGGLSAYVDMLSAGSRLDAMHVLGDENNGVAAAFDRSYLALPLPARRLFRLLGAVPGVGLTVDAVAALGGLRVGATAQLLDQLFDANLVTFRDGRFAMGELMAQYAARCLTTEGGRGEGEVAIRRLHQWYLDRPLRPTTRSA